MRRYLLETVFDPGVETKVFAWDGRRARSLTHDEYTYIFATIGHTRTLRRRT